jgi:hypothetical protein
MAWFNDYSRDYDRAQGYNRGRNPRDTPGMRSSNYGSDRGWGSRSAWAAPYAGGYDTNYNAAGRGGYWGESSTRYDTNRDYMGRRFGYDADYDRQYRRPPEQSPLYGRNADQAVQRWANRYGYDMQYEINPRQGGYGGTQGGYASSQGGYGGSQGGYGGSQGGYGGARQSGNYGRTGGYGNRGYGF